jgi:hypothetical protein
LQQQPPNDLDPVDLVAMDRCRHEQTRARLAASDHMHRHEDRRGGVEIGQRDVDPGALPGLDLATGDGD